MNVRKLTLLTGLLLLSALLTTTAQTEEPVDLTKGLVAYWSFDEAEGDIAFDQSKNHNDAGLFCYGDKCLPPKWVAGKVGYAVELNGDDCLLVHHDASLNLGKDPFTIIVWVKSADQKWTHHGYEYLIGKGNQDIPTGINISINWNRILIKTADKVLSGSTPPTQGWFHLAVVFSKSQIQIYLNGELDTRSEKFERTNWNIEKALVIGAYNCSHGPFDGILDEIRIYNRALTTSEITELYKQQA